MIFVDPQHNHSIAVGMGIYRENEHNKWMSGPGLSHSESIKSPLLLLLFLYYMNSYWGFPGGTSGKEPTCQCRRCKRHGFDPGLRISLEEGMATHSSILAWRIPWTEESSRLQSIGSKRVRHGWSDLAVAAADCKYEHIESQLYEDMGWVKGQ